MKKNILSAIIAIFCVTVSGLSLPAQTVNRSQEFASFDAIQAGSSFQVRLVESNRYAADWVVDAVLEEYVELYVKSHVLYISLNEKAVPKEIQKSYKGKNAPDPVLKVTVFVPALSSVVLTDQASLDAVGYYSEVKDFALTATDNTMVTNLSVVADACSASLSRKASVSAEFRADKVALQLEHSSLLVLKQTASEMAIQSSGTSSAAISGDCKSVSVQSKGSSKVSLAGEGEQLSVQGQAGSELSATNFTIATAQVDLNGAKAWIQAKDELTVDLKGGAELIFSGDPKFNVNGISRSSLTRYENAKKK